MTTKFQPGDYVYVPAAALPDPDSYASALVRTKVLQQVSRSLEVDDGRGQVRRVASSKVHDVRIGFLIVRVGDLKSEDKLLDPLAKALLQFMRLLVPDDLVRLLSVRTRAEVDAFWASHHDAYSHIVLIGHGSPTSLAFLSDGLIRGAELANRLAAPSSVRRKVVVSLACETGKAGFAKGFSSSSVCESLVAPFQSIHGATAAHFAETYFVNLLLEGKSSKPAFVAAARSVTGGTHFRLWKKGLLVAGRRK